MKKKCIQCKEEIKGRQDSKFCSHSCRGSFHTELKRLKLKKSKVITEIKSVSADNKEIELYNLVYGKS